MHVGCWDEKLLSVVSNHSFCSLRLSLSQCGHVSVISSYSSARLFTAPVTMTAGWEGSCSERERGLGAETESHEFGEQILFWENAKQEMTICGHSLGPSVMHFLGAHSFVTFFIVFDFSNLKCYKKVCPLTKFIKCLELSHLPVL